MNNSPGPAPSSGKKLRYALTSFLFAGLAAAIGWAVLLKRELNSAELALIELRQRPVPSEKIENENQTLRTRVAELEGKLAAASPQAAAKTPASAPPVPAVSASPIAAIAATMNNPAMRTMLAASQKRAIETKYAELFPLLQFTPEQRARFVELLSDGQGLATEAAMKLAAGNLSAAEQTALREQIKDVQAVMDQKVREFFGDESKYATYKQYTEQTTERTQVATLKRNLAQSGQAPLSAEQSATLTSLMYAERKSFSFSSPANRDPANPLAVPSADAMEIHFREQEQLNNQIANRAVSILTPEQVASLRQEQARRLESMKTSSDMARAMLGGGQPVAK